MAKSRSRLKSQLPSKTPSEAVAMAMADVARANVAPVKPSPPRRKTVFGEPAPFFSIESDVNPNFSFSTVGGRWVLLAFMGSFSAEASAAAHQIALARRSVFNDNDAAFFAVTCDPKDVLSSGAGVRYFRDADLTVSRLYGLTDGAAYQPTLFLLDRALRFVASGPIGAMAAIIDRLSQEIAAEAPTLFQQSAPVLTVPRIFEPQLCQQLIDYYRQIGGSRSGFMREVEGKTRLLHDDNHKRREDVSIEDEALKTAIRSRIERRLLPLIERSFGWKATQMERYLVARYSDEKQGFFRAHRDNTTSGTAHRKFAVSINLNADYDGGLLRFPEFGTRTYKPVPGGATVFSCSLLHEATPVTRGERFVFVPFLYDEEGSAVRARNIDKVVLTAAE